MRCARLARVLWNFVGACEAQSPPVFPWNGECDHGGFFNVQQFGDPPRLDALRTEKFRGLKEYHELCSPPRFDDQHEWRGHFSRDGRRVCGSSVRDRPRLAGSLDDRRDGHSVGHWRCRDSGTGFIMLSVVFTSVGLPIEGLALLAGIDRIREMISTVLNILGDAVVAVYVAKQEGELDERQYNHEELVELEGSDV